LGLVGGRVLLFTILALPSLLGRTQLLWGLVEVYLLPMQMEIQALRAALAVCSPPLEGVVGQRLQI
jgi:hypothetical protein